MPTNSQLLVHEIEESGLATYSPQLAGGRTATASTPQQTVAPQLTSWLRGSELSAKPARPGEAANPGPPAIEQEETTTFTLVTANVTHLGKHVETLLQIPADAYAVQEHAMTETAARSFRARLAKHKLDVRLGKLDPETAGPHGGVGLLSRRPRPVRAIDIPQADPAYQAVQLGRLGVYQVATSTGQPLVVAVIYGWTDSMGSPEKLDRTNALMEATYEFLDKLPWSPKVVVGDVNADLEALPCQRAAQVRGWTDIGTDAGATCFAPGAKKATRRDYVIANPAAQEHGCCVRVVQGIDLPVHRPLVATITLSGQQIIYTVNQRPQSFQRYA